MKIYAPVKNTNGVYASVRFTNGVGETDNPHLIDWFKTHGYIVGENAEKRTEKCDETTIKRTEKCDEYIELPDFDKMTPLELREWAVANGLGGKIKNTRNREKLLQIIRG
jgi:hypothetical protein